MMYLLMFPFGIDGGSHFTLIVVGSSAARQMFSGGLPGPDTSSPIKAETRNEDAEVCLLNPSQVLGDAFRLHRPADVAEAEHGTVADGLQQNRPFPAFPYLSLAVHPSNVRVGEAIGGAGDGVVRARGHPDHIVRGVHVDHRLVGGNHCSPFFPRKADLRRRC